MIICNLHNFQLSIAHFLTDFLVLFLSDRSKIFRGKNLCSHHQTDSNETENPSKDALKIKLNIIAKCELCKL